MTSSGGSPISILFLVTNLDRGGAEKILTRLAVGLPRDKYAARVAALQGRPQAMAVDLAHAGVPISTWARSETSGGEDGRAGRLVPAEDPTALAEVVGMLATSAGLRQEEGATARDAVEERFAIQRAGARHLSLYEELTG